MTCLQPSACRRLFNVRKPSKKNLLCNRCSQQSVIWDDDKRADRSEAMKLACSSEEWRRKQSEAKKALWADPVWRAEWSKSRAVATKPKQANAWNAKMRDVGIPFSERKALIDDWVAKQ